jgi:hypothetical protein
MQKYKEDYMKKEDFIKLGLDEANAAAAEKALGEVLKGYVPKSQLDEAVAEKNKLAESLKERDGQTDIFATSTTSFERGVIVVGRANAWVERDFSEDITGGADFMGNVARQVSGYWEDIDQDTIVAILDGIYSMTGTENQEFITKSQDFANS